MKLRNFNIGNSETLTLMGGMNVLESRDLAMHVAENYLRSLLKNIILITSSRDHLIKLIEVL